ncbi:hypothetical protein G6F66_014594 [Rhizopus arrhizus]|nr:hypothetical protein G6F66_014594 [Rhizopus arrhizus]
MKDAPAPETSAVPLAPAAAGAAAPSAAGGCAACLSPPQADRPRAMARERAARPAECSFMVTPLRGRADGVGGCGYEMMFLLQPYYDHDRGVLDHVPTRVSQGVPRSGRPPQTPDLRTV